MRQPTIAPANLSDEQRDHDVQNRLQAILLGINLLERAADSEVREIAGEVREELEQLQALLATYRR